MSQQLHICLGLTLLLSTSVYTTAQERIPFRMEGNLLLITATLNGHTGHFLLDTGSPELILNQAYFQGVRLAWDPKQIIDFTGHASEALYYSIENFSIGALSIKKQYALTADLTSVEKTKGVHLLGIIGYAVLKDLELLLDFDQQVLSLAPSQKRSSAFGLAAPSMATYDLRFSGHLPFIIAKSGKKKLRFGLDTGAEINIIDNRSFEQIAPQFDEVKKVLVKGITHFQHPAQSGTLRGLSIEGQAIGPLDMTVISTASLNERLTIDLDGILGMPFLRDGKVAIDYRKRKMQVWASEGLLVEESPGRDLEVSLKKE